MRKDRGPQKNWEPLPYTISRSHINLRLVKVKFLIHSAFLFVLQTEGYECTNENEQHSQGNKFSGTNFDFPIQNVFKGVMGRFWFEKGSGATKSLGTTGLD